MNITERTKPDLSGVSTFQMARALQWPIRNLKQCSTPEGMKYFVELNGQIMLASSARKLCESEILKRQGFDSN